MKTSLINKVITSNAGIALLIGLQVRPAALMLSITMLVAIFSMHFVNGLFMSNNGYEFGRCF